MFSTPDSTHGYDASSEHLIRPLFFSREMLCDVLRAYDVSAVAISGVLAWYMYVHTYLAIATDISQYLSITLANTIFFQFVASRKNLYDAARVDNFLPQVYSAMYVCGATFAITFMLLFFMKISLAYSRLWFVCWAALFLVFVCAGRGVFAAYLQGLARTGALRQPVALVGGGPQFARVEKMLLADERDFRLTNVLEFQELGRIPERDCLQRFIERARVNNVAEVLIALPASQACLLELLVRQMQTLAADIQCLPDFGDVKLPFKGLRRVGDFPFITAISRPIGGWGVFQKKVEDYVFATIGLVLALPVMLIIALAIKLDSKGPVFFRQRRHGYNHRVIGVLKFRTMTVLEDGNVVPQATKGDKRVTRVGRFLRRTSLDELPQLINVLRGEMSIVGPRPHALAHDSYYEVLVESYANRHRVKPGITGWAQFHGCRGETGHPQEMAKRVRYDLEYIENWSIWLDLKIITMTPAFILAQRSAY